MEWNLSGYHDVHVDTYGDLASALISRVENKHSV